MSLKILLLACSLAIVSGASDTADASGWYRCRCSLTCNPAHKRVGVHHSYNALSEGTAASMCLSDAADDCLKKYGGTSTSDPAARCE